MIITHAPAHASSIIIIPMLKPHGKTKGPSYSTGVKRRRTKTKKRTGTWDGCQEMHAPINAPESVRMSVRPSGDPSVLANSSYISDVKKTQGKS